MMIPYMSMAIRATPITPDNKSTAIMIATWLLMAIFIIVFFLREAIKFVALGKFAVDDMLMSLAVVFAIGFSVTILIISRDGLGILGTLTLPRANAIMKGYYASNFLYISSLCFSKLSLVVFLHNIVVHRPERRMVQGLSIFILTWTLASLIAVAFQCGLVRPWEMMTLRCYNSGVFWIVYCIFDMTTEVFLVALSANLVAYLKVKFARKVIVVACFAPRILVIGAALARLIYLFPITPHDAPQFKLWVPVVCTEVQICIGIVTACIPYMKPFFKGAEAGVLRADHRRSKGLKVNTLCGYQSIPGLGKRSKQEKMLSSMDSTASMSLKYGRTPDVSPRIPSPIPLSPMTPPRYQTPPGMRATSRSPSERRLRLHIPPPDILIRKPSDSTSPRTASSHTFSPQCLSPQHALLNRSICSSGANSPTTPTRSRSPRLLLENSAKARTNFSTPALTPPQSTRFSLFPRTTITPYSPIQLLKSRSSPSIPPVPTTRPQFNSRQENNQTWSHRMPVNPSQLHSSISQPSTNSHTTQSMAQISGSVAPTPIPPTTRPWTSLPPPPNPPQTSPPSPQRLRNHRILVPQNASHKDQLSPISPALTTPRTPLPFWRDQSSSEGTGGGDGDGAGLIGEAGVERWKAERAWEREPMPIVRTVGRGRPRVVRSGLL